MLQPARPECLYVDFTAFLHPARNRPIPACTAVLSESYRFQMRVTAV